MNLQRAIDEIVSENNILNPDVTISPATRGGYYGDPSTIKIEGTGATNEKKSFHLFLKSTPKSVTATLSGRQAYVNEITMYTEALPTLSKFQEEKGVKEPFDNTVRCHKCCDVEYKEFLIFDDLTEMGFVLWDKKDPMTPKCIELILKQSAKFHAVSYALQDQRPQVFLNLSEKLYGNIMTDFFKKPENQRLYKLSSEIALECIDKDKEENVYRTYKNFIENELMTATLSSLVIDKAVIIHGDRWCNNFMFKFEDSQNQDTVEKAVFLDWQCSRLSSPVVDLCYFIYCNASQEVFDNLDYYLKLYHDSLSSALTEMGTDVEKVFSFNDLQNHWKMYSKFGLLMASSLLNMYYNPVQIVALDMGDLGTNKEEFAKTFANPDIVNNEKFKERMRGIITHFVNNGFI